MSRWVVAIVAIIAVAAFGVSTPINMLVTSLNASVYVDDLAFR